MVTKIEWADQTLNPQVGCTRKGSPCINCYAQIMAFRQGEMHRKRNDRPQYVGVAKHTAAGWNWTGKINFKPSVLDKAVKRRVPTLYFFGSMTDTWHEKVPLSRIEHCFAVFAKCPQHVFQVLTKRAERLDADGMDIEWPENVWQGVSVGDRNALHYIDHLRNSPAKVKFISAEPLVEDLGEVDLSGIDWIIVGGESGSSPRPMQKAWAEKLISQALDQGVAVFFKQWGHPSTQPKPPHIINDRYWLDFPTDHPAVSRKREELATKYADDPAFVF